MSRPGTAIDCGAMQPSADPRLESFSAVTGELLGSVRAMPPREVAAAPLMAGNGVVLKPSPHAALAAERIGRVFARAGLPEGLLQIAHGHADVGVALVDTPAAQVRYTGSVAAGRDVLEVCARRIK